MMAFDFQSVAQIVAARGLNTIIEGFALAGLSWAALRYFGAQSSMTRFVVWFSTLLVIAGLPLLSGITSPHVAAGSHLPEITLSGRWATGLFVVWALIASVLLARLILSLRHLYILRKKCHELDPGSYPALSEVAKDFSQLHRSRRIQLLSSNQLRVPTALGFFRPAVILPEWTLRDLSHEELKVIVLHELAHLRRWDDWTNLAQKFVKALFFFHPAVWWIDSRLALEREIACDDMVLEQTANARIYAASLVSVAEKVVAEKMRMGRRFDTRLRYDTSSFADGGGLHPGQTRPGPRSDLISAASQNISISHSALMLMLLMDHRLSGSQWL
jgi:Zn-dependent protease with chaperone function